MQFGTSFHFALFKTDWKGSLMSFRISLMMKLAPKTHDCVNIYTLILEEITVERTVKINSGSPLPPPFKKESVFFWQPSLRRTDRNKLPLYLLFWPQKNPVSMKLGKLKIRRLNLLDFFSTEKMNGVVVVWTWSRPGRHWSQIRCYDNQDTLKFILSCKC